MHLPALLLLAENQHYRAPLRGGKSSEMQLERRLGHFRVAGVQAVVQQSLDFRIQLIQLRQNVLLTLVELIEKSALLLRIRH